ncbi:poly(3-hydroxybutyrate) depolymerase-like [Saccoglossus kowalevskii]
MAVQVQVAYSSRIMGAGTLAGGPYHCAQGSTLKAVGECSDEPEKIVLDDLIAFTYEAEASGDIDPVSNLADDHVYLFSGTLDTTVVQGVVKQLESYYTEFIPLSQIATKYDVAADFAMITEHYGNACDTSRTPYINDCDLPEAFNLLNQIYGNLQEPLSYGGVLSGQLLEFDQTELEPSGVGTSSLDDTGYIYVPDKCNDYAGCKVHIVFHGCDQGREVLVDEFALNSGYNEVADLNNIIVVYPQAVSSIGNTRGCFDWWGYTNASYDLKSGRQMEFVKNIIDRVVSVYGICEVMESQLVHYQCVLPEPEPTLPVVSTTCIPRPAV